MTRTSRRRLVRELTDALPVAQRPHAVAVLASAFRDLRGSITGESLPEMAYRLALFRLDEPPPRAAVSGDAPAARPTVLSTAEDATCEQAIEFRAPGEQESRHWVEAVMSGGGSGQFIEPRLQLGVADRIAPLVEARNVERRQGEHRRGVVQRLRVG